MPDIELQHIVSCSSADKNNPAENLLKSDGVYKWKSSTAGEKSISCIIQLSKSSQIHSIDIGNEGSAFVEILVGKATATNDTDFEVLLVASSFMSPLESRNGTNRTGVRMFGPEDLNKQTGSQSWDRIKIVCTQPFCKTSQYGLSFIKFHSPPVKDNEEQKVKRLGAFTIKNDSDDEIYVGSLFANRQNKESSLPLTPKGAAAIRLASKNPEDLIKTSLDDIPVVKKRLAESPPPSSSKTKTSKQENIHHQGDADTKDIGGQFSLKKQSTSLSSLSSTSSATSSEKSALKRTNTEPNKASPAKAFKQLMEGVVFVLSGFQNPNRGDLRNMALEMGAKYRPDWGKGCTHLICAFPNTPKYQQVAGKGKIVTKEWIQDCHKQKKLLPWRSYRLGKAPSPPGSSDEEDKPPKAAVQKASIPADQQNLKPKVKNVDDRSQTSKAVPKPLDQSDTQTFKQKTKDVSTNEEAMTSKDIKAAAEKDISSSSPTGSTETLEELNDPFGLSTDEDETCEPENSTGSNGHNGLPDLPDFFSDQLFFLYGDMEAAEKRLLTRYIAAYNGEVADYMSASVKFVVTSKKWDKNFAQALSENPNLIFVKPQWIYSCHEASRLTPYQLHIITP